MSDDLITRLERIATALERLTPQPPAPLDALARGGVFRWEPRSGQAVPVARPRRVPLDLLLGIDDQKARLLANVSRFAQGQPANHALLWGVRGGGKSALVKAVHASVAASSPKLALVDVARGDIGTVPGLVARLPAAVRVILFIDDLSFDARDDGYKALKTVLDGGVDGTLAGDSGQVLVLVTSNRRHLVARGDGAGEFRPDETAEEQISLSDRFGLWLGFHPMDQDTYLAVVRATCARLDLAADDPGLEAAALVWSRQRGARSGRTAWQFVVDRAGSLGRPVHFEPQEPHP